MTVDKCPRVARRAEFIAVKNNEIPDGGLCGSFVPRTRGLLDGGKGSEVSRIEASAVSQRPVLEHGLRNASRYQVLVSVARGRGFVERILSWRSQSEIEAAVIVPNAVDVIDKKTTCGGVEQSVQVQGRATAASDVALAMHSPAIPEAEFEVGRINDGVRDVRMQPVNTDGQFGALPVKELLSVHFLMATAN